MSTAPHIHALGDRALLLQWGGSSSPIAAQHVRIAQHTLAAQPIAGIIETVPSYNSLTVHYDPLRISQSCAAGQSIIEWLTERITQRLASPCSTALPEPRHHIIQVCYDGDCAPDIDLVAQHTGLTRDAIIELHSAGEYHVQLIGFTPGFAYLGGLAPSLEIPRLSTPRSAVPPGSIGIAGQQTGIYPLPTPGGWHLIGRTAKPLFLPNENPPVLLRVGDRVSFQRIVAASRKGVGAAP
jgi:KipI family sensor histidine kinase inhibitor